MKSFFEFSRALDRNELTYWLGLGLLFAGLALGVSAATALSVCGAVIVLTSAASSFFMTWLSAREAK